MEKQPEEPAVTEAGSAGTQAPEAAKSGEPVVSETEKVDKEESKEKDPVKEAKKSEQKEVSGDVGSEKKEEEKDEEPAKKRDEPEGKKEDDPEETAEEFEDAVDTVGEPDDIELPEKFTISGGDSTRSSRRGSVRSDAASSDENMPRLRVTESETVEIESSPEKSPKMASAKAPRPGPSKVVKSPNIETVDLDDDDDDEYDEGRSFEEEDDDDYYDDPESDDQDVNRVIQDAVDEIDAMENPESGEEDKMDVSSDDEDDEEDDYSYDDDDDERQQSVVAAKRGDKRKKGSSVYSEGEIYDADDGDEYDQVGEVDEPERGFRPPKSRVVSLGQITLDDDSDEEEASPKKQAGGKVKYKSYRYKLVAGIRKRTFKILNKRSMHVMAEGSDATLVCSAEATTVKAVRRKELLVRQELIDTTTSSSKSPAPEEARLGSGKPESSSEASEAAPVEEESKKSSSDENKENMTVKDNSKEQLVAAASVADEKVKQDKEDEKKKKKESEEDEVMSGMLDDLEGGQQKDCTYRNGSKTEDFNDELTFQMDVDGGSAGSQQSSDGGAGDDTEEGDDDEDEEQGAVDLSSSTEAVNKPAESSPEKSSTKVDEPVRKLEVPVEKPDLSSAEKVVKIEPVEQPVERREEPSLEDLSSKTSPKEKPVSRKRRRSVEEYEDEEDAEPVVPSKKLKRELECNFRAHDRLLKEYIETTSNDSMEDVQKNTELLMVEIQTLNDMIRAKENEWNNMIHLKKVKEEILMRLTRKKNVLNLVHTKLGEEPPADYSLFNVRSASVGPRPPTPPPEVDIRPASVTPLHNSRQSANTSLTNDSRRHSTVNASCSSNIFAQFNHINSSVTMVPLSTSPSLITSTNTILQSRANMKPAELAKEKPNAAQIQRQILPKPILSNHQQILNNLAMSAGLTAANATSSTISNTTTSTNTMAAAAIAANNILAGLGLSAQAAALLNGHHNPGHNQQQQQNHLQVGRQGVIKDVKSIIADYRQKHPEQVPRRGRRLKNIPSSSYDGKGGSSADARMREFSFLLAAAENTSRPSSNDSSQSNSNAPPTTLPGAVSFKDVLVQFAKMSQSDRTLLSSLSSLSNAVTAAAASAGTSAVVATTTNCSSSSQQRSGGAGNESGPTMSSLGKGGAYPEVTLHPVMNTSNSNSTATTAELNLSNGTSANQSQANSTSNSLLHGILTKSSSRPNPVTVSTAVVTSNPGFTSFSPTLARLLTAPERMNSAATAAQQQQAATVTSGALANLQASTGLNLSKSNSEITITPVGGGNGGGSNSSSSIQQSLLQAAAAHQQLQEQQKQLQRLREQHFMNMDDEAEDSVDRLVIDEGDDHHDGGHVNNSGHHHHHQQQRNHGRDSSLVITTRGGSGGNGPEFHENDVPECQGCKKREAQFVCAGCGNQWYCSRECQVNAWDDHSEVCTG